MSSQSMVGAQVATLFQFQPQSLDYRVSPVGSIPTSRRQLGLATMQHVTGDPSLPQSRTDLQA